MLLIISFIVNNILLLYLPYLPSNISFFMPLLPLVTLVYLYPKTKNKEIIKKLIIITIICSMIFNDYFLVNLLAYFITFLFIDYLYTRYKYSMLIYFISILGAILIYLSSYFIILFIVGFKGLSIILLLKQISSSIIINLFYAAFLYYIFGLKKGLA